MILANQTTTVELPAGVEHTDRLGWTPFTQSVSQTISGAVVIERAKQQAGRHITLASEDEGGWITTQQAEALQEMLIAGEPMTLSIPPNDPLPVTFRYNDNTPIQFKRLYPGAPYYTVTIKLMELS